MDSIWGVEVAYMLLVSKYNKTIRILLCIFDAFSKYAWVIP